MGQVHTSHLNSSNVSQLFLFFFVIFLIVIFHGVSLFLLYLSDRLGLGLSRLREYCRERELSLVDRNDKV